MGRGADKIPGRGKSKRQAGVGRGEGKGLIKCRVEVREGDEGG